MEKMSRKNARKIEFYGTTLDECVNALLEFKSRGESVFVDFNGHQLYSCDVTMDSAYLEVCGRTKAEVDKTRKERGENYTKKQEEAKAKIPDWIERGSTYIYPEKMEKWAQCVEARAGDIFSGEDLDSALELMEKLESGASMEEVKEIFEEQRRAGRPVDRVRDILLDFAKRGPEFYESTASEELLDEEKKVIADKKEENTDKEVQAERKTEEQEITDLLAKKEQLTVEISNIEQQLQDLKAKVEELKNDLGDKQSQLNGLEEK